ncbi:hypothetical protein [Mesorhizobium sp. B2-3-5]|uniref:hypothetical protein n=1 Tax=Mesorhizobium sp. B2-3-5 TaxID=2589958 RepID=UPI00112B2A0D|nr:hypothetical protein [Mesorhizobium sp. B2-3-5]TPM27176.1 hypothetical protein FJ958_18585 [Mesorhizobium sp. B2-3-5]
MAFVFVYDENEPLEIIELNGNGEHIARVAIGYDDETDHTYSVVVALSPLPGHGGLHDFELVFSIVETYVDSDHSHSFWDGTDTKPFLADAHQRTLTAAIIVTLVSRLIDVVAPDVVTMTTYTSHLPAQALQKFHQIALVFAQKGYNAGEADPWNGQRIWMMTRNAV